MGVEVLVPAIVFGSFVGIVWLLSHFNYKKKTQIHETLRHSVERGEGLSEEMLEKLSTLLDPKGADRRRGVLLIATSFAIMLLAGISTDGDVDAIRVLVGIAMFPLLLGVAYLGLWFFGRNEPRL